MRDALLAVGTRKGLFLARSTGGGPFEVEPVHFSTIGVPSVAIDTRGPVPASWPESNTATSARP
nr:hypothetical protein GCM10020093_015450 [Planobispora longispora]